MHGYLSRDQLHLLITAFEAAGYRCIGPQVQDGAILYHDLKDTTQLPRGVSDQQAPGTYRLTHTNSPRQFAWANGPQALKPLLFAAYEPLWHATRDAQGDMQFEAAQIKPKPLAIIGVRACDLAALRLQDAHFLEHGEPNAQYAARRQDLFLVAVNCTHPAATCFCVSTGDGPNTHADCDLVLDELEEGLLLASLSDRGAAIAALLPLSPATAAQHDQAEVQLQAACAAQKRSLPSRDLRPLLNERLEHSRWKDVAERCLSCGNCTSVCPTCFCYSEQEQPQLDGAGSTHVRAWDSCFTQGHSYIHGITIRADTRLRYRQWLTHKLAAWHDQYGRSGCVGCGRCISWCPVGIDMTEEIAALAASPQ